MDSIGWLMVIVGGAKLLMSALLGWGSWIDGLALIFVIIGLFLIISNSAADYKKKRDQLALMTLRKRLQDAEDIDLIFNKLDSEYLYEASTSLKNYVKKHPGDPRIIQAMKNVSKSVWVKGIDSLFEAASTNDESALKIIFEILRETPGYILADPKTKNFISAFYLENITKKIIETGYLEISQSFFKETADRSMYSILGLLSIGDPNDNPEPIQFAVERLRDNPALLPDLEIASDMLAEKANPADSVPLLIASVKLIPLEEWKWEKYNMAFCIAKILRERSVSDDVLQQIKAVGNITIYFNRDARGADDSGNVADVDAKSHKFLDLMNIPSDIVEPVTKMKPKIPF